MREQPATRRGPRVLSALLRLLAAPMLTVGLTTTWTVGLADTFAEGGSARLIVIDETAQQLAAASGQSTSVVRDAMAKLNEEDLNALLAPLLPAVVAPRPATGYRLISLEMVGTVAIGSGPANPPQATVVVDTGTGGPADTEFVGALESLHIVESKRVLLLLVAALLSAVAVFVHPHRWKALGSVGRSWLLTGAALLIAADMAARTFAGLGGLPGSETVGVMFTEARNPPSALAVTVIGMLLWVLSLANRRTG